MAHTLQSARLHRLHNPLTTQTRLLRLHHLRHRKKSTARILTILLASGIYHPRSIVDHHLPWLPQDHRHYPHRLPSHLHTQHTVCLHLRVRAHIKPRLRLSDTECSRSLVRTHPHLPDISPQPARRRTNKQPNPLILHTTPILLMLLLRHLKILRPPTKALIKRLTRLIVVRAILRNRPTRLLVQACCHSRHLRSRLMAIMGSNRMLVDIEKIVFEDQALYAVMKNTLS
jgi:hypothetical protein